MKHLKLALGAGVALCALVSTDASAAVKHKKKHVVTKTVVRTAPNAELLEEVRALREQVATLRAKVDGTSGDAQATAAQVASTQARIDAVQAQVAATDSRVAAIPATVTVAVDKATDKARHADKFYFKGITITPGGFLELAGIYRQHQMGNDIATGFNSIPYANSRVGQTAEGRFSARQSRLSFLAQGDATKETHLGFYGEFDFQGAAQTANSNESNSYNPRIRNLYGTVDYTGTTVLASTSWPVRTGRW